MLFLDTCALLNVNLDNIKDNFIISSLTLEELENIKSSNQKDNAIKFKARQVVRFLKNNPDKFNIQLVTKNDYDTIEEKNLSINNDKLIIASAKRYNEEIEPIIFYTCDLLCEYIAQKIFGLDVGNMSDLYNETEKYTGYKEIVISDEELAYFYENSYVNIYNCLINQYIILKNKVNEVLDIRKWTGEEYVGLSKKNLKSISFDRIKPKDHYQKMVIDSIMTNTMTAICGHAGSGKSLLSLAGAMSLIDNGAFDRLVILTNPIKTASAADIGYYSGNMVEKLMQNSIGNVLTTKFGDKYAIDTLLNNDKLKLVSMADVRGMEIKDNEILYITECQNTSKELLKLCLTRASKGCKIIIEGDYDTQVDSYLFEGNNNGMRRVVEMLKGNELFGFVELKHIYRSKIAELIDVL